MNNHSLAKIKLKANEFMQEYERQETNRQFEKQRLKKNVMIEIMSFKNKSQTSQSNIRELGSAGSRLIQQNSRTLSANVPRSPVHSEDRNIVPEKKSLPNASRISSKYEEDNHEEEMKGAQITFKMQKNRDSYILVQGQSQNEEDHPEIESSHHQSSLTSHRNNESSYSETVRQEREGSVVEKVGDRRFKFAEAEVEPDSSEHEEIQQIYNHAQPEKEEKNVFLTMEEDESMSQDVNANKNCAFEIVMDKSEPIDNMDELRKKKFEMMEKRRMEGIEEFRRKEELKEQRKLDSSVNKGRASHAGYSRKSQTKISEDVEPEPPKGVSRRKISGDKETRANLSSQNIAQESHYGVRAGNERNVMMPGANGRKVENMSYEFVQTPKTVASEARDKSRNKNTIFKESPKRYDKSASKYSQDPKIQPKDRKNAFSKQSNKKLMITAITNVCLPGELNRKEREKLVEVIDTDTSEFFVFLFKDYSRKVIKAIYTLDHSQTVLQRVYGEKAPFEICCEQVKNFYRFDSGSRDFKKLDGCKSFSLVVHAIDLR